MELFTTTIFLLGKLYRALIFSSLTWINIEQLTLQNVDARWGEVDENAEMTIINGLGHQIYQDVRYF